VRHRVYGKHLGRNKNQRINLFRGLVRSLILNGSIQTTDSKAKAIKGLIDKLVTASKKNTPAQTSQLTSFLTDPNLIKKFNTDVASNFKGRDSGFTKVVRLGRRSGDAAMIVKVSWVSNDGKVEKEVKAEETEASVEEVVEEETVEEKPVKEKKAKK
jgi:large subunit ribosomal protein L17